MIVGGKLAILRSVLIFGTIVLFFGTIVLFFGTPVDSQSGVVRIRPSGGLNTISDDFSMPLEDSRIAHNIDFSLNIGGLTVRKHRDSVSALSTAWDSIVAIHGAYYSDGSQQLFMAADSAGVGYGNIIFGAKGSSNISSPTIAMGYWSIQNKTNFEMVNDRVYAVNGQQKGFVWNGRSAHRWPIQAPGEPTICPLKYTGGSSWKLNGEYRYQIQQEIYDNGVLVSFGVHGLGTLSPPVVIQNGRCLLSGFTFSASDSVAPSVDSAKIIIFRSRANITPLDGADSLYRCIDIVGKLRSIGTTFDSFYIGASGTVHKFFVDSLPDDSLVLSGAQLGVERRRYGRKNLSDPEAYGRDGRRYGAPVYMGKADSIFAPSPKDSTHQRGLMFGIPLWTRIAGWAWVVTLLDTSNANESDTTRSLFVIDTFTSLYGPADTIPFSITIGLPRVSSSVTGVMKNIYRAPVFVIGHDTTWKDSVVGFLPFWPLEPRAYYRYSWRKEFIRDSAAIFGGYYLVATVPSTDSVYVDDMRYDSLVMQDRYRYKSPPVFSDIFSFSGRLYGMSGSRLYFSVLDTVTRWGAFDFISLNEDDGDIGTVAFPARGVIRYLKNRSNYNVFQGANLGWNRVEVSGYFGCIAPNSHAATINGHYYLSDIGVIRETEGANLERTQSIELISAKLKQFADFSVSTARKINAFSIPNEGKVLFSLPDTVAGVGTGDTTYVYDERTNTWATWSEIVFSDATLYGAESAANFIPGDTMYFIKPGGRTLWRYGATNALGIPFVYESAPIGIEGTSLKQVDKLGVWGNGTWLSGIPAVFKNENNVAVSSLTIAATPEATTYRVYSVPPDSSSSIYHRLLLSGTMLGSLRAFDIYQSELGEKEER